MKGAGWLTIYSSGLQVTIYTFKKYFDKLLTVVSRGKCAFCAFVRSLVLHVNFPIRLW